LQLFESLLKQVLLIIINKIALAIIAIANPMKNPIVTEMIIAPIAKPIAKPTREPNNKKAR
jgi:hypothetical protein